VQSLLLGPGDSKRLDLAAEGNECNGNCGERRVSLTALSH
jgi:hypothetical protein